MKYEVFSEWVFFVDEQFLRDRGRIIRHLADRQTLRQNETAGLCGTVRISRPSQATKKVWVRILQFSFGTAMHFPVPSAHIEQNSAASPPAYLARRPVAFAAPD